MKSRIIRVFISSTFRDMNVERDYLNKIIFPQIRSYCEKRFLQFLPIDLRWGITEEASRNGLVLSTCMEEVDNSRPFFIGILGSRYGWQPTLHELEQLRANVQKEKPWLEHKVSEGASITEMEIEYGVLRDMEIPYASFFIRSSNITTPEEYHERAGSDAERHLERLKKRIRSQKKYPVTEYTSIEQFGDVIKHQIIEMIEAEYPASISDAEDAVIQHQEKILEQRSHILCDMTQIWNLFQDWVNDNSKQVLLISGAAGTGTSTVLSYCCSQMKEKYSNRIIYFDLESASKGTKPFDALFHFLNMEQNQIPDGKWGMVAIDNASMLRDKDIDRILSWLKNLDVNIHVVFATEQNSPLQISLSYALNCPNLEIGLLPREQKRQFVNNFVQQFGKQLTEEQVEAFLNLNSANVSTLIILLRSLVNYGSYEDLNNYISQLTKNTFSQHFLWAIQKESLNAFAAIDKLLGNKYMVALTAISAAGTGISEADLAEALEISAAEWSVLRPNVLQFCKGNEDGWKLSNSNWYPNVSYEDWEYVSRHLIKWYTAHPEKWYYAAPAMRHIFYLMIIPPFFQQASGIPIQADRPIVKDVLDELFAFAMSPDMVRQLNDMEYSIMWTRPPLTTKNMSDTPTMIYGRTISELSSNEAIAFYNRLANIANGLSRSTDAAWCYQQIENILVKNGNCQSFVYEAKKFLVVGQTQTAIDILNHLGFIVQPNKCAMQQLLDAYCACRRWKEWTRLATDLVTGNANMELMVQIAYAKSGCYSEIKDGEMAWKLLQLSNENVSKLNIGHPISCLHHLAQLVLCFRSINSNLSEDDRKRLYSAGWWTMVSANMCYGAKSYQCARAHLLFTYIHYKCYHDYGKCARRLHDYVERDEQGRALNHTDEYFYGAFDYGRYLENNYKRDVDWTKVNREVQIHLLDEYDFFWNIENEIQPEWYKFQLQEKRDTYQVRIHLLDKMPPKTMTNKNTQQKVYHCYEQSQHDFASNRLEIKSDKTPPKNDTI